MRELQDQVRDLMFYLETQKKIADTPEETRQVRHQGSGGMGQCYIPTSLLGNLLLMCRGALPSLIPRSCDSLLAVRNSCRRLGLIHHEFRTASDQRARPGKEAKHYLNTTDGL